MPAVRREVLYRHLPVIALHGEIDQLDEVVGIQIRCNQFSGIYIADSHVCDVVDLVPHCDEDRVVADVADFFVARASPLPPPNGQAQFLPSLVAIDSPGV